MSWINKKRPIDQEWMNDWLIDYKQPDGKKGMLGTKFQYVFEWMYILY